MNNTTLYFIRHGDVYNPKRIVYNRNVIPLSEKGFKQIESLAKRLKSWGVVPVAIYTSPLRRSLQSSEKISEVFAGTQVVQKDNLQDADARVLEGKPMDWLISIGGDIYNNPETRQLVEKPKSVAKRMLVVIEEIRKKHIGETFFVVGHGDPMAFAIWRLLHPEGKLPSIADLAIGSYLKKGESWRFLFDQKGKILENQLITRDEKLVRGEREY